MGASTVKNLPPESFIPAAGHSTQEVPGGQAQLPEAAPNLLLVDLPPIAVSFESLVAQQTNFHGLYGWLLPTHPSPANRGGVIFLMRKEDFYARRMHTPDDPERAAQRAALREISKLLLPLHRALIDSARDEYTANGALVTNPTHLLQLITEDPFFAWLKPITSLIVDIDEMVRVDFTQPDVAAIATRVDRLFGNNVDEAFATRYVPILQRDVDVAIAHAAIRQALAKIAS